MKIKKAKYPNGKDKKATINLDIIKACESIMKKSNQNDMKNMAREYLK